MADHNKETNEDSSSSVEEQYIPPTIKPRSIYDKPSRMGVIQVAYDQHHLEMKRKRERFEKKQENKKKKKQKEGTELRAIQDARNKKEAKQAKAKSARKSKYEFEQPPGQVKITSFATPVSYKASLTSPTLTSPAPSNASTRDLESDHSFAVSEVQVNKSFHTPKDDVSKKSLKKSKTDTESSTSSQYTRHSIAVTEVTACSSFASPPAATSTTSRRDSIESNASSQNTNGMPNNKLAQCLGICRGCKMQFHLCWEQKHRNHCLHAVVDYFDKIGYDAISTHGIREVYYNKFLSRVKDDLLKETELYELRDDIPIPDCMLQGSLADAMNMIDYNTTFRFLEARRMVDVKGYLKNRTNDAEWEEKRFGKSDKNKFF